MRVDAAIFGGGVAGLWLLDELVRRGCRAVLLEAGELGRGQTLASQGILHGGLKYTLQGMLTGSAAAVAEMPLAWRECLAGRRQPDLTRTRVRAAHCHLWRTESLGSRLGMIGAKFGLRVAPEVLAAEQRPPVLAGCPGTVARLDEPVISPASLIADLAARHCDRILQIDADGGLDFETSGAGDVRSIRLSRPRPTAERGTAAVLAIHPGQVVFAAGAGNAALRARIGLNATAMQRRPLHMVLVRGELPPLNGHCVDGAKTRVTITSDTDSLGRIVWQVGGQVAEDGVRLEPAELIAAAHRELEACIPGLDLAGAQWGTYRVDRAEGAMPGGRRPESVQILREGNVMTAWPTKLVLAPRLAEEVAALIPVGSAAALPEGGVPSDWPRPAVAAPPWEDRRGWFNAGGEPVADDVRKAA